MLLDLYPQFIRHSYTFQQLFKGEEAIINQYLDELEEMILQLSPQTATTEISRWENIFGVKSVEGATLQERREKVIAKIRGSRTTTVAVIKSVCEAFTNGRVDVTENTAPYTFEVKFTGTLGMPPNYYDLQAVIEEIKPAHLAVIYVILHITWNQVDAKNYTWDGLDALNVIWDNVDSIVD